MAGRLVLAAVLAMGALVGGCGSDSGDSSSAATTTERAVDLADVLLKPRDFPAGFAVEPDDGDDDDLDVEPAECKDFDQSDSQGESKKIEMKNDDDVSFNFEVTKLTDDDPTLDEIEELFDTCASMTIADETATGTLTLERDTVDTGDTDSVTRVMLIDMDVSGTAAHGVGMIVLAIVDGIGVSGSLTTVAIGPLPADTDGGQLEYRDELVDLVNLQIERVQQAG